MATEDTRLSTQAITQTIGFYIIPVPYQTFMLRKNNSRQKRDYTHQIAMPWVREICKISPVKPDWQIIWTPINISFTAITAYSMAIMNYHIGTLDETSWLPWWPIVLNTELYFFLSIIYPVFIKRNHGLIKKIYISQLGDGCTCKYEYSLKDFSSQSV